MMRSSPENVCGPRHSPMPHFGNEGVPCGRLGSVVTKSWVTVSPEEYRCSAISSFLSRPGQGGVTGGTREALQGPAPQAQAGGWLTLCRKSALVPGTRSHMDVSESWSEPCESPPSCMPDERKGMRTHSNDLILTFIAGGSFSCKGTMALGLGKKQAIRCGHVPAPMSSHNLSLGRLAHLSGGVEQLCACVCVPV